MKQYNNETWPLYTCTACFVFNALKSFGVIIEPEKVAKSLNIRVPIDVANPFGLTTTEDANQYGLTTIEAKTNIRHLLSEHAPLLIFKHLPLSEILYQMYEETIDHYLNAGFQVGIGYDYSDLSNDSKVNRHVSFISRGNGYRITDYYEDQKGMEIGLTIAKLIWSSSKIQDGLWLIGKQNN